MRDKDNCGKRENGNRGSLFFLAPSSVLQPPDKLRKPETAIPFVCLCVRKKAITAGIGRLDHKSARLVHPFLCSIYGAKCDHQKNMPRLWRYVASKLVPLRPKAIKNELNFGKWTIKMVNNLCQNSYEFMSNFQVEKKFPKKL